MLTRTLPKNTILTFAKNEGDFALCFDSVNKKSYYIKSENIIGTKPNPGEILKYHSPGNFYVDHTGIPINENKIETFLSKCELVR